LTSGLEKVSSSGRNDAARISCLLLTVRTMVETLPKSTRHSRPSLSNQQKVPAVIITTSEDRSWIGGFLQGEGCIQSHFVKGSNSTTLDLAVGLTDQAPVFKFADFCRVSRPVNPRSYKNSKPAWIKSVTGVRAVRILTEILPFLVGGKLLEAERALIFFGPNGYHRGHFRPADIWPANEFPFRKRHIQKLEI
jgi:hypothetical protein